MGEDKKVSVTKPVDYSFKILESVLTLKQYSNKDEVMNVAQSMVKTVQDNNKYSNQVKTSYLEAYNKLNALSFDEMKEIIEILSSYDEN